MRKMQLRAKQLFHGTMAKKIPTLTNNKDVNVVISSLTSFSA
jgi:hypothetical protein